MASRLFEEVFDAGCGTCMHTCDCGITHFDSSPLSGWDWEEGELKKLQKRADANDTCVEHGQGIGYMTIGGSNYVYGCSCNGADKYEKFILSHASLLAEFLNKLAQQKIKEAQSMSVKEVSQ